MAQHDEREDEKLRKQREAYDRERALMTDAGLTEALKTSAGREFIWWLLQIGGIGLQPFAEGAPDKTAFNCGELNVGNQILSRVLQLNPDAYVLMQQEQATNAKRFADSDSGNGD